MFPYRGNTVPDTPTLFFFRKSRRFVWLLEWKHLSHKLFFSFFYSIWQTCNLSLYKACLSSPIHCSDKAKVLLWSGLANVEYSYLMISFLYGTYVNACVCMHACVLACVPMDTHTCVHMVLWGLNHGLAHVIEACYRATLPVLQYLKLKIFSFKTAISLKQQL